MKTIRKNLLTAWLLLLMIPAGFNLYGQEADLDSEVQIKTSAVCGGCKERIESNMVYEKGVTFVSLDLLTKVVTIRYNPKKTNPDNLRLAISNIGYDADDVKADEKKYENLPACCKKDAKPH